MVVAVLVVLQVIIWKETNGNWNKLYEFCEHKSSGSYKHCSYVFYIGYACILVCGLPDIVHGCEKFCVTRGRHCSKYSLFH